jgi:hypothetical protein
MTMNTKDTEDTEDTDANSANATDQGMIGQDTTLNDADTLTEPGKGNRLVDPESTDQNEIKQTSSTHRNEVSAPSQVPLLDNIVFNTSLPLKVTTKKPKPSLGPGESVPRPTDLFGGTPETATLGPLSAQYQAHDIDGKKTKVKAQASQVVDALVEEYSTEIVRRLKDELTTLLDELDTGQGDSKKE